MTQSALATFDPIFQAVDGRDFDVLLPDTTASDPLLNMLGEALGADRVGVAGEHESTVLAEVDEPVRLLRGSDVVATSPLQSVLDTFLLINSDLYRTGTSGVDTHEAPAVLTELDEVVFTMDGYPESTKQKLLLILISRFIENTALTTGGGRLDSAFQRLSRLFDESGTAEVYRRLAESDVELHVYGEEDAAPLADTDATVHAGVTDLYRRTWFVVNTPPPGRDGAVALVAIEVDRNTWRGLWTYREDLVSSCRSIIDDSF